MLLKIMNLDLQLYSSFCLTAKLVRQCLLKLCVIIVSLIVAIQPIFMTYGELCYNKSVICS